MKLAILYICTGKYNVFWESFYRSCEQFFFPNEEKHYFVFTDGQIAADTEKIHRIEQKNLGWPGNTLYRFQMFWNIKEQLVLFDYIFFFNANCEFLVPIGAEFLPSEKEKIVVIRHPGFYNKKPDEVTYDRNPKSLAYIPFGQGLYYICGGVNGGICEHYINLINSLREAIIKDDSNGVVAVWHDESHINKYILSHPYKLLSPAYCYPEGWDIPFEKVIIVRDKNKFGGHDVLRGVNKKNYFLSKVRCIFRTVIHKIINNDQSKIT